MPCVYLPLHCRYCHFPPPDGEVCPTRKGKLAPGVGQKKRWRSKVCLAAPPFLLVKVVDLDSLLSSGVLLPYQ